MIKRKLFGNFKEYSLHNVKLMGDIVVQVQRVPVTYPVKYPAWVQPLPPTATMSLTSALIADTAPQKLPLRGQVQEFLLETIQIFMV